MHRSEAKELVRCAACGEETSVERDRGYAVDPDTAVCFVCALARGGRWSEEEDRWLDPPDVTGLLPEGEAAR